MEILFSNLLLIGLLLVCIGMHFFMHRGHGPGHHSSGHSSGQGPNGEHDGKAVVQSRSDSDPRRSS